VTARRFLMSLLAPLAAITFALLVSSLALLASGNSPMDAYSSMLEYGTRARTIIGTINRAIPLYVSAIAVAVGFRMGLFNIGVEGQYRLAAILSASAGAAVTLPAVLHVPFIILVAMVTGGAWAGVAGVLKATRGIHEVISTIMLNTIATGLGAWLLANHLKDDAESLNIKTPEIPGSGRIPSLNSVLDTIGIDVPNGANLQGFLVGAIVVGIVFYVVIERTRFGFDLRSSGLNPFAAQASGVDAKAMVVKAMVLSGAVAGLVGISQLLGFFNRYTLDFPTGLGFTGIGVALLGRNRPVGMAVGALLFGFLSTSAQVLDLEDVPKEIVDIMQGVILLSVVVAYEVVRRLVAAAEVRAAAEHEAVAA
jgi:general nucleoside transport system permease protein